ncbi:MAG TPA: histidine kinase, partial [Candidatus Limnocylindria bacterium]|nr:histidine kinase [Candidatus Limnocylindria bacterium]
MSANVAIDLATELAGEQQKIVAEIRELDLLVESTQTEVNRLKSREDQTKLKVEEVRGNPGNFQREEIFGATDEHASAISRRMTMEGQLGALQGKRKLLDRVQQLLTQAQEHVRQAGTAPAPMPGDAPPVVDEGKLLQAVVDTQEAERKRIARQVHDGPAQAMANVVLQSEISERLFGVDPNRSRTELAALRQMVNKTLQELRGFIFELRPMILDDLGLVPTMRRYVQTLIDKHGVRIDFSSTGRDRRLPSDDEVAIFRL